MKFASVPANMARRPSLARSCRRFGASVLMLYDEYPDFRQPAVIFHGIHDTVVPPAFSRSFANTHPNAHLRLLDSDHELLNVLDAIWQEAGAFLLT